MDQDKSLSLDEIAKEAFSQIDGICLHKVHEGDGKLHGLSYKKATSMLCSEPDPSSCETESCQGKSTITYEAPDIVVSVAGQELFRFEMLFTEIDFGFESETGQAVVVMTPAIASYQVCSRVLPRTLPRGTTWLLVLEERDTDMALEKACSLMMLVGLAGGIRSDPYAADLSAKKHLGSGSTAMLYKVSRKLHVNALPSDIVIKVASQATQPDDRNSDDEVPNPETAEKTGKVDEIETREGSKATNAEALVKEEAKKDVDKKAEAAKQGAPKESRRDNRDTNGEDGEKPQPSGRYRPLGLGRLRNEVKMLALVQRHPNVIQLHGLVRQGPASCVVLLGFCAGGDLFASVANSPYSEERCREIMLGLLSALSHIHMKGIVHRDVKVRLALHRWHAC
eukprot:TRINITY_DN13966_c0_g1_i1.p1 TRINITY_DN13966_c0_g1~~TRINITY_DN13966_c0_g1_i1.p1  ORF type:complete len:395 (-),score=90.16 TRINITY_DN13966_c0_g1_i1:117-1301(-)